jgi:hypothetical protein
VILHSTSVMYYFIELSEGTIKLMRHVNGVTSLIAEYFGQIKVDDIITLTSRSGEVTVSVNGKTVISIFN